MMFAALQRGDCQPNRVQMHRNGAEPVTSCERRSRCRGARVLNFRPIPHLPANTAMSTPRILDEIGAKLSEIAAASPARDIEKNVRALLGSAFGKLDLVTREEFDVQREVLAQTRRRLAELEARVAELEAGLEGRDKQG